MKNDLINILSNSSKDMDNQVLMDYISGKLSDPDQHAVEAWLEENQFAADALEGLQEFGNTDELQEYVRQLNLELKSYLQQKKDRRNKKRLKEQPWIYTAIVLILSIAIIGYVILRMLGKTS